MVMFHRVVDSIMGSLVLPWRSFVVNRPSSHACRDRMPRTTYQTQQQEICWMRNASHKPVHNLNRCYPISSGSSFEHQPNPITPLETIQQFYTYINIKEQKKLRELISNDCFLEDCSFGKPLEGKQEVMRFYEQLMESTGSNVKFNLERICEGDEQTVWAMWHLDWKEKPIPFTRGCSIYKCSEHGQKLMIKRAQVMIESPIKPGMLALSLLKMITYIFDNFPKAAERFLQKPQDILTLLLKIYSIFLEPLIYPILVFYINLWKIVSQTLGYILSILITISKIFK